MIFSRYPDQRYDLILTLMIFSVFIYRFTFLFTFMFFSSVFSEEYPPIREEDVLAKWASDPANTAWMESKESYPQHTVCASQRCTYNFH